MRQHAAGPPSAPRSLSGLLTDWTSAGLITDSQATAIRARETGTTDRVAMRTGSHAVAGRSLVVEALGYLGGAVMLVGATILVSFLWADISTGVRLLLIGGTAFALIAGGFAISDHLGDAAGRLRSVLWAAGVASSAGFFAVLSSDVLDQHTYHSLLVIGPAAAVIAAPLWRLRRTWLQQLALFIPLLITADGLGLELASGDSGAGGAWMWGVGVGCATVAMVRWFEPRTTGVAFGVLGGVAGSLMLDDDRGIALGLLTATIAIALALGAHSLPWLGVSTIALLATAPRAANQWFPGRLSASLAFIIAGGILVTSAVWVARRRKP